MKIGRRKFLKCLAGMTLTWPLSAQAVCSRPGKTPEQARKTASGGMLTLFLCGDVMTGRGIDQILPYKSDPRIYEPHLRDARDYIALAESANGPIPRTVPYDYVWGDALAELARRAPDARIGNLETAVTLQDTPVPKGINYRMHPANVDVLTAAAIDCCALANNHMLDWGPEGLKETLAVLRRADIQTAGAGNDLAQAQAPAIIPVAGKGRVLVFAFGSRYSGIGLNWGATSSAPGIDLLSELTSDTVTAIGARVAQVKEPGDIAVASIHWGGNWGYEISAAQRGFARGLIDRAGIDVVHGHSSHHVKGIEVYRERAILYGCGDFLSDYEGIRAHEEYRSDLGLMYLPTLDAASGRLCGLELVPTRVRKFRIQRASPRETDWLADVLNREGRKLGTSVRRDGQGRLWLAWRKP
jgi:poly-gamma-glutamate synthesis protein (capsule biosynthesis protein)